jgi:hypothetical protein
MPLTHVMHALVSYWCLIVHVWNQIPTCFGNDDQNVVANRGTMFTQVHDETTAATLPAMAGVLDSPYAKVGDAAYDNNGSMQFLETRWERKYGNLFPT